MTKMSQNNSRRTLATLTALGFVVGVVTAAKGQTPGVAEQQPVRDSPMQANVRRYADALKYSPQSTPIDSSRWDLLHPWLVETPVRPMHSQATVHQAMSQIQSLQAAGLAEDEEDALEQVPLPPPPANYRFELNKTIVAGTHDELRAHLTLTGAQNSDAALHMHVIKAQMIGSPEFGAPNLGEVPFTCEAASPACTFTWRAPSEDRKYWGILDLEVTLALEGLPDTFVIGETFYSSPMVAGRFTGQFAERLEDGSLVIDAGVAVPKRMACFATANLYSVDHDIPLQHTERRMLLDPSMKTLSFTFFGKIFRDYGDEGAFRLQDLKVQCRNLPYPPEWYIDQRAHQAELAQFWRRTAAVREPSNIYFEYNTFSYTTQRYSNGVFSDAEWQSPQKSRKLANLKKAAEAFNDPAWGDRKQRALDRIKKEQNER